MNKKGQALVLFVIMLPLIVFIIGVVVEKLYLYGEKKEQHNLAQEACRYYRDNKNIDYIEKNIMDNDQEQNVKITVNDNRVKIILVKYIDNLFNKKSKIRTELICK